MNRRRALAHLFPVILALTGAGRAVRAAAAVFDEDDADEAGECGNRATTGRAEAGRDCATGKTYARVDNRPAPQGLRAPEKRRERPIDRLLSRGQGRIKASGDKAAIREFREKQRRGN